MSISTRDAGRIIAAALILTVITQIAYMALSGGGQQHIAYPIWRMEALAALAVAVLGFVVASRHALVGGCLVVAGLGNMFQTGVGLTMFYQLGYGGDTPPNPVFFAVLANSFFLYFAAKAALGVAGIALGMGLWRGAAGAWRWLGGAAALTGLVALVTNAAAMCIGMDLVFVAGAAGTLATLLLALSLWRVAAEKAQQPA